MGAESSEGVYQLSNVSGLSSRRSFISALTTATLGAIATVAGCAEPGHWFCKTGEDEPPYSSLVLTPELAGSEYVKLMRMPNLQKILSLLSGIQSNETDPELRKSGYQILIDLLEHSYNPKGNIDNFDQVLAKRLQNVDPENKIFILLVAQSLYVEKNRLVPWSLTDYSKDEINALFFNTPFQGGDVECRPPTSLDQSGEFRPELYPERQLDLDAASKLFPLAHKLVKSDRDLTLKNVIRWIKSNFFHAYSNSATGEDWGWEHYLDGRPALQIKKLGNTAALPASLDRYFDERISGCHEPIIVLAGILRALNIPAFNLRVMGHGVTALPTMDRFVHGDHLCMESCHPSEHMVLRKEAFDGIHQDPMLMRFLDGLIKEPTGEYTALQTTLHREGPKLFCKVDWKPGGIKPEWLDIIQKEMPQYNVRYMDTAAFLATSDPIEIRSLRKLRDPGAYMWE